MIIEYSTSPNLTMEEKLRSLRDSVQRALDETADQEAVDKIINVALPQLEKSQKETKDKIMELELPQMMTTQETATPPSLAGGGYWASEQELQLQTMDDYDPIGVVGYHTFGEYGTFIHLNECKVRNGKVIYRGRNLASKATWSGTIVFDVLWTRKGE